MDPNAQYQLAEAIRVKTEDLAGAQENLNAARTALGRSPTDTGALARSRTARRALEEITEELKALEEAREAAIAFDKSAEGQALQAERGKHRDDGKTTVQTLAPIAERFDGLVADLIDTVKQMDGVRKVAQHHRAGYITTLPLSYYEMETQGHLSPLFEHGPLCYALVMAMHRIMSASGMEASQYITWNLYFDPRTADKITMSNAARDVSDHVHATFAHLEKRHG